jgi:hypothetical protein
MSNRRTAVGNDRSRYASSLARRSDDIFGTHTCRVHLFVHCPDLVFPERQCVGYDHRWGRRIGPSSSRLPLVPPRRPFAEKTQVSRRIEYLDPTGR